MIYDGQHRMHTIPLRFGWPIFRRPLVWGTFAWFISMFVLGFSIAVLVAVPDKWDRAIAIKVCGGLPVVQREDGTVWLRHRWRAYRVDNPETLC
jgi:hypothetical protein